MKVAYTWALLAVLVTTLSAEVYLSEQQALKIALPKSEEIAPEVKALTPEQREELQKKTGLRFPEPQFRFLIGKSKGQVDGYALIMNEIGKHEFITFIVGLSPRHEVSDVAVMEFRETRGWEVKEQRFLRQFRGKKSSDPIQINRDIVNYTGATLSSQAISRGVRKALALVDLFYPPK